MNEFWQAAISVAGLGAIGCFVLWSLYRGWLRLPIFSVLNQQQTYLVMIAFLVLTFLALLAILATYLVSRRPWENANPAANKVKEIAVFGCDGKISRFEFDGNGQLSTGIAGIHMGEDLSNVKHRLEECNASYVAENDSPAITRLEVSVPGGLLERVTYFTYNSRLNTIAFSLAPPARHEDLREAARARFGAPSTTRVMGAFHYDVWNLTPWEQLNIAENGGSLLTNNP